MANSAILKELELDIKIEDLTATPGLVARKILKAGLELTSLLERPSNASTKEMAFRQAADKDEEAKAKAAEIVSSLLDILSEADPMVVYHVNKQLKEVQTSAGNIVRHASATYRSGEKEVDKDIVHKQYIELRKWYENYRTLMASVYKETLPFMPAKPGNYQSRNKNIPSMIRSWVYITEEGYYTSVWALARHFMAPEEYASMGTFMDIHEWIENNPDKGITIKETPR